MEEVMKRIKEATKILLYGVENHESVVIDSITEPKVQTRKIERRTVRKLKGSRKWTKKEIVFVSKNMRRTNSGLARVLKRTPMAVAHAKYNLRKHNPELRGVVSERRRRTR